VEGNILNRLLIRFTLLFVILLILIPIGTMALNHDTSKTISIKSKTKEKVVGSLPEANVTLYAVEREGDLEGFRLGIDGSVKYFPYWVNVSNKTYWPQLFYKDINKDGVNELIIVLTTGYGTGVKEQTVHVFQKTKTDVGEIYREINVDNPISILKKNVKTNLTKSKAIIIIGNKRTVVKIEKLGIVPAHLSSDVVTGNIVHFDVLENELTAIMGAQIAPAGGYIGDFYITYKFKDDIYQVGRIKFIPLENS
jgi:hypothetical protein